MDTKEKILQAALKEFSAYGLEGARVDQIAIRAGVNKAMIYYHFTSKENLYKAVISAHFSRVADSIQTEIEKFITVEELLRKVAFLFSSTIGQRPEFIPIFIRELAAGGDRIKEIMQTLMTNSGLTSRIKSLIEKGIAEGTIRKIDPIQTVVSFLGMNMFYLVSSPVVNAIWGIKNEDEFRQKRPEAIIDLLLYGIKVRQDEK